MGMPIEGAIACLIGNTDCRNCKYCNENCRQDAIDTAVRSMKAQENIVKDITRLQGRVNGVKNKLMVGLCLTIIENDLKEVEE